MIAVCNTSPISSLIQIGQLTLLENLFTELWIPPEVAAELDEGAEFLGDWRTALGAATIRTRPIANRALLDDLSVRLHVGEAAAITLATEIDGAVLIIDDSPGRKVATTLGVRCTGTVGLLVLSKQAGHVARIAPLLEDLRGRSPGSVLALLDRRALDGEQFLDPDDPEHVLLERRPVRLRRALRAEAVREVRVDRLPGGIGRE